MPSDPNGLQTLASEPYLLLTTYRRDGTAVSTPVWVSSDGTALYVWTRADSGKLKRLQHTSRVGLAPCDARGRVSGPTVTGTARILDAVGTARAASLHRAKYRLQFVMFNLAGRVAARWTGGEVGIAITLD